HPRFKTPAVSVVTYAVLVWLLAASGGFLTNLSLSAVSRLFTYAVVCAALPRLRILQHTWRTNPARFHLPPGWFRTRPGMVFSLIVVARVTWRDLLLLGVPLVLGRANWLWARKQPPNLVEPA